MFKSGAKAKIYGCRKNQIHFTYSMCIYIYLQIYNIYKYSNLAQELIYLVVAKNKSTSRMVCVYIHMYALLYTNILNSVAQEQMSFGRVDLTFLADSV